MDQDQPAAPAPSRGEPRVDDGELRALDPRVVAAQRLARMIAMAVILFSALPFLVTSILFGSGGGLNGLVLVAGWLILAGLLAWWAFSWPELAYRYASYAVDAAGIEIRRGVVWRRAVHVPRSRVQHTDVSQGPIERSYGIGTLVIYTAGTDFARVQLAGLAHETALRIRDHLLPDAGPDAV